MGCVLAILVVRCITAQSACSLRGTGTARLIGHSITCALFIAVTCLVQTAGGRAAHRAIARLRRSGAKEAAQCLS